MDNPFNLYSYSSVVTHEYNPYNTNSSTTMGYNVPAAMCYTTK